MKFLVGLALCCAAIFVVADARSGGAPPEACNDLTPQHGNTEQEGDNPWMIDISSFRNGSGYYYVPGYTYNSKMETYHDTYLFLDTSVHINNCTHTHTHTHTHIHTQSLFVQSMKHPLRPS